LEQEKVAIAERYLVPKAVSEAGLSEIKVNFERAALHKLIHSYAREAVQTTRSTTRPTTQHDTRV
jgi:ATP-dependent Lon protease